MQSLGLPTNGAIAYDLGKLDHLDVSLDTLSVAINAKIGRNHFDKTLRNLAKWIAEAPQKLIIRIIHYGQAIDSAVVFCKANGLKYTIQPLNPKDDYHACYNIAPAPSARAGFASCAIAAKGNLAFGVDGHKKPCCFIKYPTQTYAEVMSDFSIGKAPKDCSGCAILKFDPQPKDGLANN